MIKIIGCTAVLALALSATPSHAAPPAAKSKPAAAAPVAKVAGPGSIGKGDTEFGVFGNYTTFDDVDSDQLTIGVTIGKFLSDTFELRIAPTISYISAGATSGLIIAPVISGEFLFRNASRSSPVVPFVGGGIGIDIGYFDSGAAGDFFNVGLSIGPTGGVKYFVTERASLEFALTYLFGIGTSCGDVDCFDTETNTLKQALRFNFYY